MFQIGISEIVLTLIIAIVVLGPEKLPEVARTLGKTAGQLKNAWQKLQGQGPSDNFQ